MTKFDEPRQLIHSTCLV